MIWDKPPQRPTVEDFTRFFSKVQDDINRVGWSAVGVMDNPPFTYTVGLTETYGHPELIIYGLDPKTAHHVLAAAVHWIKEMRERDIDMCFKAGERYDTVLEGYKAEFREHPAGYPMNTTATFYEAMGKDWEALQLVWPDKEGRFPGEEGMDPEYEQAQEQREEE